MVKPRYREVNGRWTQTNKLQWAKSWDAAGSNRLTSSWTMDNKSVDYDIQKDLRTMQARALEGYQNNDHIKRFVGLVKANVVGPDGVKLQVKAMNTRGQLDKSINETVEAQWRRWGRVGSCDVTGKLSWVDLQNQIMTSVGIFGEALVREYTMSSRNEWGYSLQMVDPRRLDPRANDEERGIKMGIECDSFGAPVNYWLVKDPKVLTGVFGSSAHQKLNEKDFDIVPASKMIHVYLPEFVVQTRGVPMVAASLYRLAQLKGYEEAELIAARVAASKIGFFEYDSPMGTAYTGDDVDADGNQIMSTEPGEWQQLPPGVRANMVDPNHPVDAFGDFVKAMLRGIASGLGVSYNSLASDLEGVNFSSLRQGALEERETWKCLQRFLIDHVCERVYEHFLRNGIERRVIPNSTGDPVRQLQKLSRVEWQGRRWEWVDPLKNAQADREYVSLGAKSLSEIIREDGRDPNDVFEQIAADNEMLSELGVELTPAPVNEESNDDN